MIQYKTRSELKDMAKDALSGRFGNSIFILFLVQILSYSISYLFSVYTPGAGIFGTVFSILSSLAISTAVGIFNTGICLFFLNIACGHMANITDLFYGFTKQTEITVKIAFFFAFIQTILLVPFQLCFTIYVNTTNRNYIYFAFFFFLLASIIYLPVSLLFSQCYFLILDFPSYSTKEILLKSIKLMKHNLLRLFLLELSFLPLMFLCLLTCGIGFLWLRPYMVMTKTYFFLDLMKQSHHN